MIARAVTDNADERASSPVTDARHQPGADAAPEASDVPTRKFLMVSAPFGPFARELANELRRHGAHMTRVLLNGGDLLDWGIRNAVPFFGALSQWRPWLVNLIGKERFTDILCYGDSSPYAVAAVDVAASTATRLHVLEQGYFRPDWVTLEAHGVNANSRLPRDPQWYRSKAAESVPADPVKVGHTTPAAVRHIVSYHLAMYLGAPLFSRFKAHYSNPAYKQAIGHVARYGTMPLNSGRNQRSYEHLTKGDHPVFLCVLQRPGDSQLWRHSEYVHPEDFIERVLESFSVHAPKNARLIVRPHPLDPGLLPYRRIIRTIARRFDIEDRVRLTDHGKLHEILPRMAGVVCVNSTAGLAAIEFGRPTIALGQAIYRIDGMTHRGDLDGFWRSPQSPDPDLYLAFRQVLLAETQVNGAFATRGGRKLAVPEIARRLLRSAQAIGSQPSGVSASAAK